MNDKCSACGKEEGWVNMDSTTVLTKENKVVQLNFCSNKECQDKIPEIDRKLTKKDIEGLLIKEGE